MKLLTRDPISDTGALQAPPPRPSVAPRRRKVRDNGGVESFWFLWEDHLGRGTSMAAMKPRTGDGPLEVTKEGRGIVMRVPLEGGGRLVVELSAEEAAALGEAIKGVVG
jgi:hypothetical protein